MLDRGSFTKTKQYYNKEYKRLTEMKAKDFEMAKQISSWKKRMARAWNNIDVVEKRIFNQGIDEYQVGQTYIGEIVLDLNELSPQHIGVELVLTEESKRLVSTHEFELEKYEVDRAYYKLKVSISQAGTFTYGVRIFPKNPILAHRQDFSILRWI